MARVRWSNARLPSYVDSMWSNTEAWQFIRKAPGLVEMFDVMGDMWVNDLNMELNAAQARRKQPIEDGYKFAISHDNDRIRMRIWAFTARAMVHEAKHQSILRLMGHSGFDVNRKGKAKWDWGTRKKRKPSGNKSRGGGRSSGTSAPRSGSGMDPAKESRMRRQLAAMDLLAKDKGATESERKLVAERARRFRSQLGE